MGIRLTNLRKREGRKQQRVRGETLRRTFLRKSSLMTTPVRRLIDFAIRLPAPDMAKAATDLLLIIIAAAWTWGVSFSQVVHPGSPLPFLAVVVLIRLGIYFGLRLHRLSWLHVSRHEVLWLAVSALMGPPLIAFILFLLPPPFTLRELVRPLLILVTEPALYLLMLCGARICARAVANSRQRDGQLRKILIVGAGAAGHALAFQIQESMNDYDIVGFVDDDARLRGRRVRGIPVLGPTSNLAALACEYKVHEIVVAIPSLAPDHLRQLLVNSEPAGLPVRILPPLEELIQGKADVKALREVRMEDLLPRPEVNLDRESISRYMKGRTVMVTGGGGSIGGELCRQALVAGAARLLVLGRGENSVFEMMQELSELGGSCELVPVICDVRDRRALERVYRRHQPQVVFHAAAHKHVPLMEQYPSEAIKNNVLGTLNAVELAVEYQVERFVMVSTDKAVDPTSVMGATKRIGEMIVRGYAAASGVNMVSVRFGNVLGSRGSVVPTMTRQIRRGLPVTVTDPEMVRYFMTIPEAVQLILQAGAVGGSGEVFILDMGHPVRILDLAHDLIRLCGLIPHQDIPINIVGRRPGEKVREDILTSLEAAGAEKKGAFYMATPQRVEVSEIVGQIEKLRSASEDGDDEQAVKLIHNIVPDFGPDVRTRLGPPTPAPSKRPLTNGSGNNGASSNGAPAHGAVRKPSMA